jgi:nucleolar protein 4
MLSKKDAERAIEGCNGLTVRAGLAEGMVSDKQKKKKQRRVEKKMKEAGTVQEEDEEEDELDDKRAMERVIAVDWALSKDKWKEEKAKMGLDDGGDVEMTDASDSGSGSNSDSDSSSGDSDDEDSDESDGHMGVHEGGDSDDGSSGEEDDDEHSRTPIKPQLPPPEEGTTLFVRNVPFSATEDELRTL